MEIYQLKYFVTAAKCRSFTKASDALHISRQALSKTVKKMEEEIGEPLFRMAGNSLELTEAGRTLLEEASAVVDCYDRFCVHYEKRRQEQKQVLNIVMAQGVSMSLPPSLLDAFRAKDRKIILAVEETYTDAVMELVGSGEFELGLVGSHPAYLKAFDCQAVVPTGIHVYVPEEDVLAEKPDLTLEDLDGRRFVTAGKRNHLHRFFMERCEAAGVRPEIAVITSDAKQMTRLMAEEGLLCFGFSPKIQPVPPGMSLKPLLLEDGDLFGTYVIRRKNQALSPEARKMWNYLGKCDKV